MAAARIEYRDGKRIEISEETTVFKGFFNVERAQVAFERFDGNMSRESQLLAMERGDSVGALIHDVDSDQLILVKQFRYPTVTRNGPGWTMEIIAGGVRQNEAPEEAIKREIIEEVGYAVDAPRLISSFYLSPGGSTERLYLFFAAVSDKHKVSSGGGAAEENEDVEIVRLAPLELKRLVDTGGLIDAKTLIAALWFFSQMETVR